MSKLNEGNVTITLNEQERVLKPSLRAMSMLSTQFGGLGKVRQLLVDQELNAAVAVIRLGLNLSDRDAKSLPDEVYENGLNADLLIGLINYVGILSNGGKPLPDAPVDKEPAAAGNG